MNVLDLLHDLRRTLRPHAPREPSPGRRLALEPLEPRRVLSVVTGTTPDLDAGLVAEGTWSLRVEFSEAMLGAGTASNYELCSLGPDGRLGTADDATVPLSAGYSGTTATLNFAGMGESIYRLTVKDTITDTSGNPLDGDNNGTPGGKYVRDFVVNLMAGTLDPSFAPVHSFTTDFGAGRDYAYAVAIQADGKIVVAGTADDSSGLRDFALARYNVDGSLDTTFAGDGRLTTDFAAGNDCAKDVAIQADGKIVAVGYADNSGGWGERDFALARYNVDGSLDTSFSQDGKLLTDFAGGQDWAHGVAVQADGRIVVAGFATAGGNQDFALARYLTDGGLDPGFHWDGRVVTDFAAGNDAAESVAIQADGKIVAAGWATIAGNEDFALLRYQDDGQLDTSFPGGGGVTTDFAHGNDRAHSVAIQGDGKIVVAGSADGGGSSHDFALARYWEDGILDTSFHWDGRLTTDFASGYDSVESVALQADGKIVVAGSTDTGGDPHWALARYNTDGNPDTAFGSGGKLTITVGSFLKAQSVVVQADGRLLVAGYTHDDFALIRCRSDGTLQQGFPLRHEFTTDFASGDDVAHGVAIQADGKIVVAGHAEVGGNQDFALVRYDAQGKLDTGFDGDGKLTTDFGIGSDRAKCVAIQANGRIVAAGYADTGGNLDFGLARYHPDGTPDSSFAGTGRLTTAFETGHDYAQSLAIQADGRIVVAGVAYNGSNNDFAVARYHVNGSLDHGFNFGGKRITDFGTGHDCARGVAIQADGKIVLAGYAYNGSDYDFALARYNPDGSPDAGFGSGGTLTTDFGFGHDYAMGLTIQADGKIVLAGYAYNGSHFEFALARYHPDGSLDGGFGSGGTVTTDLALGSGYAMGVTTQADGKIVAAGYVYTGNNHFALVRYNTDGTPDTSFDGDGKLTGLLGMHHDKAYAVAIQPDGKIVLAGDTDNGTDHDFAVVRFAGSSSADLASPGGFRFDVDLAGFGSGQLLHGTHNPFDGLSRLQANGYNYAPPTRDYRLDDGGRTVITPTQTLAGLNVHREITVPGVGGQDFARTLDVFENPTGNRITVFLCMTGNLGSDAATTVFGTSDGDGLAERTDLWIGTDDAPGTGSPAVVHYIHGPGGLRPGWIGLVGDNIEWTYLVTVDAGETVRLAHFTILNHTRAGAMAAANALATAGGFHGQAAAFLSQTERDSLVNFQFGSTRDTVGLYDPGAGGWHLKNTNASPPHGADIIFRYGPRNSSWTALSGDWNGDGVDTAGLYDPGAGGWHLKNTNASPPHGADVTFRFGPSNSSWLPLVGDWDGDGVDTVGLYDPGAGGWHLKNTNASLPHGADVVFRFGPRNSDWTALVGDWNGDGVDTVGLYDPGGGGWHLKNTNASPPHGADVTFRFGPRDSDWRPLAGDWNGDGVDSVGLYDPSAGGWHLKNINANPPGGADVAFRFGPRNSHWFPLVGDWNGPGKSPLMAAGGEVVKSDAAALSEADLQPLIAEAFARWDAAGVEADFSTVGFTLTDLPGTLLGLATLDTISIDHNAAGHGWFVDPTPGSDEEFAATESRRQRPAVDPRAVDRMDLMTVLSHELGHVVGLDDLDPSADGLMSGTLPTGVRREPGEAEVDALLRRV